MFVKPGSFPDDDTQPLIVRGPNGWVLPPDGADVPAQQFWFRRLRDGDVVEATPSGEQPASGVTGAAS